MLRDLQEDTDKQLTIRKAIQEQYKNFKKEIENIKKKPNKFWK